jgi:hypothetical protein
VANNHNNLQQATDAMDTFIIIVVVVVVVGWYWLVIPNKRRY